MREKKYRYITCREMSEGIIYAEYIDNLRVDLSVAKEMVAYRLDFAQNKEHYIIFNVSNVREVTSDAKDYMQNPEGGLKNILGAAFLADNPLSELIASIFIKTPKNFEARLFSHIEDAVNWIRQDQLKVE